MKVILASAVFFIIVAMAIAGRWYGLTESLSMYARPKKPLLETHRFSLGTLLMLSMLVAVMLGVAVVLLRGS
jgi:hypothetical protein